MSGCVCVCAWMCVGVFACVPQYLKQQGTLTQSIGLVPTITKLIIDKILLPGDKQALLLD